MKHVRPAVCFKGSESVFYSEYCVVTVVSIKFSLHKPQLQIIPEMNH